MSERHERDGRSPASLDDTLVVSDHLSGPTGARRAGELQPGDLVGRYVVLAKLGAGGMGIVYAVHDPELDRKLAIKLLRVDEAGTASSFADGRTRLLREAQALAKLAHPHVVAVHDVGEHEGGVYLAMEFVEGTTLAGWLSAKPRTWREVLAVMRSAAFGLIAAHEKGLLHRDVKPDNIMIGTDGRVRMMDFGLARAGRAETNSTGPSLDHLGLDVTRAGSLLGTPAYMAPEQWAQEEVGPAADQFGFCVTLWEALFAERPFGGGTLLELAASVLESKTRPPTKRSVPAWLRRACAKGLARNPSDRWPSMQALVDELDRAQSRVRVRAVVIGVAGLAVLGGFGEGLRRSEQRSRLAECEAAGAEIDGVWNGEVQQQTRASMLATGAAGAEVTADKVMPWLDAHAAAWRAAREQTCLASTGEERTALADSTDKALWCLDETRLELAMLVDRLGHADQFALHDAVQRAVGLTSPSQCVRPELLAAMPALPQADVRTEAADIRADLARAAVGRSDRDRSAELQLARGSLDRSKSLGYGPLIAASSYVEGELLIATGRAADAEPALVSAYVEAAKVSAWSIAADAAIELTYVVGERLTRPEEGRSWALHAEVALAHADDPLGLREATRLNNLALLLHNAGDDDESQQMHERVLAVREAQLGPDHLVVAASLTNLANLHSANGQYDQAKHLHERALAIHERALGTIHPAVANTVGNLAGTYYNSGDLDRAASLYERALGIQEQSIGEDHPHLAITLANLANVRMELGDYPSAKLGFERALAIQEKSLGADHPNNGTVLNNLGRLHWRTGELVPARQVLDRALAIREKAFGPEHPNVATVLTNLALVDIGERDYVSAAARLERALAIRETAGPAHPHIGYTLDALAELELAQGRAGRAIAPAERAVQVREAGKVGAELIAASQFLLARALAEATPAEGADRAKAIDLAKLARGAMREGEDRTRVDEWLASRDDD